MNEAGSCSRHLRAPLWRERAGLVATCRVGLESPGGWITDVRGRGNTTRPSISVLLI